jgi:hypothetical protein
MLFDASGNPMDYRFLETNPVFNNHVALVGRLLHLFHHPSGTGCRL